MFVCAYIIFPEISVFYEMGMAQVSQLIHQLPKILHFHMLKYLKLVLLAKT